MQDGLQLALVMYFYKEFIKTFWNTLKMFDVCELCGLSLYSADKVLLFQNSYLEIYDQVSWEIKMHQYYFVLVLTPDIKHVY